MSQLRVENDRSCQEREMEKQDFRLVKELVQLDSRGRLTVGAISKGKSYRLMVNDAGQILLDPVVAVSESEMWLWKNPEAIAAVTRGLQEVADGNLVEVESFAQYADLEIED
jgi:glycine cleavage system aminomethyltransferase T